MQYNIINCSHCAIHHIPMTYLFYNRKFVPFNLLTSFAPLPTPRYLSVLCIYEFGLLSFLLRFHI